MVTLNSLFKNIQVVEPEKTLEEKILRSIALATSQQTKRNLMIAWFGFVGSFVALIFFGWSYGPAFLQSDFWNLISLLFSDAVVVADNWSDFSFSLLETFPAFSIILLLFPVFTFLLTFSMYAKLFKKGRDNDYHGYYKYA